MGGRNKGRLIKGKQMYFPYIEPNVIVYTDAKVFGPVIIENNNYIKAGKIITHDILNERRFYESFDN